MKQSPQRNRSKSVLPGAGAPFDPADSPGGREAASVVPGWSIFSAIRSRISIGDCPKRRGLMRNRSGNIALSLAVALPAVLGLVGATVDYGRMVGARGTLQEAADAAALAGAKELRLAGRQDEAILSVARDIAAVKIGSDDFRFEGGINPGRNRFSVEIEASVQTLVLPASFGGVNSLRVSSEAEVQGGAPVCLLSLDPADGGALTIDSAKILANGCAVYSNASDPAGIEVRKSGLIQARGVCSAGGVKISDGSVSPKPNLDCPRSPDPIAGRLPPAVGSCDFTNHRAVGVAILGPGVYCGGLEIRAGASAVLTPGVYVIKDGPLEIDNGSTVNGVNVGFYFTGDGAVFDIKQKTVINLTAPLAGPLAGMLFFEDRANPPGTFKINSRAAPVLLGTFYMPNSQLEVGYPGGAGLLQDTIGALSAWTIVVARKISINDGIRLTLNSDFSETNVPVPLGLGAETDRVVLTK